MKRFLTFRRLLLPALLLSNLAFSSCKCGGDDDPQPRNKNTEQAGK